MDSIRRALAVVAVGALCCWQIGCGGVDSEGSGCCCSSQAAELEALNEDAGTSSDGGGGGASSVDRTNCAMCHNTAGSQEP